MQSNAIDTRSDEIEIDLIQLFRDILRGFWKYGWFIAALISIVGTICFFAARYQYTPFYSAYTTFTVNTVSTIGYNSTAQKKNVTNRIGSVFPYILTSDALRNLVIEDMGYADFDKFPAEISASVVKDTNLVTLQVTSEDPQIAYDTLRSVLRNYPSISDVAICLGNAGYTSALYRSVFNPIDCKKNNSNRRRAEQVFQHGVSGQHSLCNTEEEK